jgi:predicted SnoaL-like aldol condensation-catalyzing enzyme
MQKESQVSKLDSVMAMETSAFQGKWDIFKSFFTDDVYFKSGSTIEISGADAIAEFYKKIQETKLRSTGVNTRGTWEFENVVIIEMDVQAIQISNGQAVEYPSVDIFRFKDDKISEWRVYPVYSLFVKQ